MFLLLRPGSNSQLATQNSKRRAHRSPLPIRSTKTPNQLHKSFQIQQMPPVSKVPDPKLRKPKSKTHQPFSVVAPLARPASRSRNAPDFSRPDPPPPWTQLSPFVTLVAFCSSIDAPTAVCARRSPATSAAPFCPWLSCIRVSRLSSLVHSPTTNLGLLSPTLQQHIDSGAQRLELLLLHEVHRQCDPLFNQRLGRRDADAVVRVK